MTVRAMMNAGDLSIAEVDGTGSLGRERAIAPRKSITVQEARRCLQGLVGVVVDDDTETFGRIFVSLDHVGCRVRMARRYVQGEKMARELRPSFVIVGTGIDGSPTALMRAIKSSAPAPLVIALAAADNRHERRRLLQNGFDGYLAKPVDLHLFAQEMAGDIPALAELRSPHRGNS